MLGVFVVPFGLVLDQKVIQTKHKKNHVVQFEFIIKSKPNQSFKSEESRPDGEKANNSRQRKIQKDYKRGYQKGSRT